MGDDDRQHDDFLMQHLADFQPVEQADGGDLRRGGENDRGIFHAMDILGRLRKILQRHDPRGQLGADRASRPVPGDEDQGEDDTHRDGYVAAGGELGAVRNEKR